MKEYEEFLSVDIDPWELEEGNDVDNDDDDEDPQQLFENILADVISQTEESLKREVNDNERGLINELIETVSDELRNIEENDETNDEDIRNIAEDVKKKALSWFESTRKRKPTATEADIIDATVSQVIVSATVEEDNDDDGPDRGGLIENITKQLIQNFTNDNGRVPNDEECQDLMAQAEELVANASAENDDDDDDKDENGDDNDEEDDEAEED